MNDESEKEGIDWISWNLSLRDLLVNVAPFCIALAVWAVMHVAGARLADNAMTAIPLPMIVYLVSALLLSGFTEEK